MDDDSKMDLAMSYIHPLMGEEDPAEGISVALKEQDRFLPIANVSRIMKKGIPKSGKIARDARECVQECVSEFISFLTSEASDRCQQEKRKTINGEDILWAMNNLGFENYVEPLKTYLQIYREVHKGDIDSEAIRAEIDFGTETTQADIGSYVNPGEATYMEVVPKYY